MKKLSLDKAKVIVAILLVAVSTYPLLNISPMLDFLVTRVLFRICIPLILMTTGYFTLKEGLKKKRVLVDFTKKILLIYGLAILLYLPVNLYIGTFHDMTTLEVLKSLFITGTFYHLWIFPSLILGIWLTYFIIKKFQNKHAKVIFIALFMLGLLGDSYYAVIENFKIIDSIYQVIFDIFDYTRNGIFYVPIFLYLGYQAQINRWKLKRKNNIIMLVVSVILLLLEGCLLHRYGMQYHNTMYVMLVPVMISLFTMLVTYGSKEENKDYRLLGLLIYILHPMMILVVRFLGDMFRLENYFIDNNLLHFAFVLVLTLAVCILLMLIKEYLTRKNAKKVVKSIKKLKN